MTVDASGAIDRLLVLNPEGDVPGLIICPTVEGVLLGHGPGCSHVCLCVVCIIGTGESDSPLLVDSASTEHQFSDSIHNFAILHHGVTQPVLHPSVGTALVVHGVADVCCPIQTGHGLPLIQGRAGDEVGSSGHDVVCVVHATIISTGSDGLLASVCHLANWLGRLTSLCYLRT